MRILVKLGFLVNQDEQKVLLKSLTPKQKSKKKSKYILVNQDEY